MQMKNKPINQIQQNDISYYSGKKNILKCKLVFIGEQAVGKSSIISRFIKNQFYLTHHSTVGIDFISKNLTVGAQTVRLQLWDTAGQQRFRSLIRGYLRGCNSVFVVFDLTQIQTFESITHWIEFIKQSQGDDALIYIVGNKSDLSPQLPSVQLKMIKQKIQELKLKYFEVSAKTGKNIEKIFLQVCADFQNHTIKEQNFCLELQNSNQFKQ